MVDLEDKEHETVHRLRGKIFHITYYLELPQGLTTGSGISDPTNVLLSTWSTPPVTPDVALFSFFSMPKIHLGIRAP
jgi:hypothetical protein